MVWLSRFEIPYIMMANNITMRAIALLIAQLERVSCTNNGLSVMTKKLPTARVLADNVVTAPVHIPAITKTINVCCVSSFEGKSQTETAPQLQPEMMLMSIKRLKKVGICCSLGSDLNCL